MAPQRSELRAQHPASSPCTSCTACFFSASQFLRTQEVWVKSHCCEANLSSMTMTMTMWLSSRRGHLPVAACFLYTTCIYVYCHHILSPDTKYLVSTNKATRPVTVNALHVVLGRGQVGCCCGAAGWPGGYGLSSSISYVLLVSGA